MSDQKLVAAVQCRTCKRIVYASDVDQAGDCCFCTPPSASEAGVQKGDLGEAPSYGVKKKA